MRMKKKEIILIILLVIIVVLIGTCTAIYFVNVNKVDNGKGDLEKALIGKYGQATIEFLHDGTSTTKGMGDTSLDIIDDKTLKICYDGLEDDEETFLECETITYEYDSEKITFNTDKGRLKGEVPYVIVGNKLIFNVPETEFFKYIIYFEKES